MKIDSRFLSRIRKQFPAVEATPSGRKRAFLDNGAGTLVTKRAADREYDARIDWSANVGNHFTESIGAEERIMEGRSAVADLLNAEGPGAIISGESATSLMFSLSYALGREFAGSENVVTTGYEHYTNINPWVELGSYGEIKELRFAEFDKDSGKLDPSGIQEMIDSNTKVVTVTGASNVLGTRTALVEVGKIARDAGAFYIIDAVHHVPHELTDVRRIGCDFLIFSGYKLFSRHGSFMYAKPEHIRKLTPYRVHSAPKRGPGKWEWGTRDQAMFAAITGAVDYLAWVGNPSAKRPPKEGKQRRTRLAMAFKAIERYEKELMEIALHGKGKVPGLNDIPGLQLYGPPDIDKKTGRDPTFSFKLRGYEDRPLSKVLWDKYRLALGAEDFFSRVPALYNKKTMLRATFVHYNSRAEVLSLLSALDYLARKKK
ncbi:MAG: aminotransferase class V-fold PLP-dependent enzyme [Methanobacteriota archaeon]|nr:MAG: aminotransferase class V-fold PLP-dependent enzyme [Euryarchaeota archaeon]